MIVVQINSVVNTGSTGRIAEEIGCTLQKHGDVCYLAYGRKVYNSKNLLIKIGNRFTVLLHGIFSRLFDIHGKGSNIATKRLVKKLRQISPDIIHLHNIHGYYLNYSILFDFLKEAGIPVVWTLHDCWAFTGHCAYYTAAKCDKWIDGCFKCKNLRNYPAAYRDNTRNNYEMKKKSFTGIRNLTIVTPSEWLAAEVRKSFLNEYPVKVINNGVDLSSFHHSIECTEKIILGVANVWEERKGLDDFVKLSKYLKKDERIVLIGVNEEQVKKLPDNITGIERTENIHELVSWYSKAIVYFNPTYEDNFPTTNMESLACGTPVITYNTGGSPEILDDQVGFVISAGDIEAVYKCVSEIVCRGKSYYIDNCIEKAKKLYNKIDRYNDYIKLYNDCVK